MKSTSPKVPWGVHATESYGIGEPHIELQSAESFLIQYLGLFGKVQLGVFTEQKSRVFERVTYYRAWDRIKERELVEWDDGEHGWVLTHRGRVALGQVMRLGIDMSLEL